MKIVSIKKKKISRIWQQTLYVTIKIYASQKSEQMIGMELFYMW